MKKTLLMALAVLCTSVLTASAGPIVINGDFEAKANQAGLDNSINLNNLSPNQWDVYAAIPGWISTDGAGIEVQATTIVPAHSGNNYIELDSNNNSSMQQNIAGMTNGSKYLVNFWYQPRTSALNDNGISVYFGDSILNLLGTADGVSPPAVWQLFSFSVTGGTTNTLKFWATGTSNSLGGFIDDVSVTEAVSVTAVPDGGMTLTLLGSAVMGLGALRRKFSA